MTSPPFEASPADNLRGAAWMLASVAGATAMTVCVRELSAGLDTRLIAFLRSALGLAVLAPLAMRTNALARLSMRRPWLHAARGALVACALNAGFYALANVPVATATVLFFLAPVFSTLLAPAMLGERVGPRRWAAVGAGFLGALVVLRPWAAPLELAALSAAASSLCFALALLLGKIASREDGSDAVFASTTVISAVFTAPFALPVWETPDATAWAVLVALAAASALRGYADIRAMAAGDASFVAPVSFLRLPAVALAGWVFFSESVDGPTIAGGAIIAGASVAIALRERALGRARNAPPPVEPLS